MHGPKGGALCLACGHREPSRDGTDPEPRWWAPAIDQSTLLEGLSPHADAAWGWYPDAAGADHVGLLFLLRADTGAVSGLVAWDPRRPEASVTWVWGSARPWGWNPEHHAAETTWVTSDHPFDAWAMHACGIQALAWPPNIHPDAPGGGDWSTLVGLETLIRRLPRLILAFQDTESGHRLEEELARRAGAARCLRTRWPGRHTTQGATRGAAAVWRHHGAEAVKQDIAAASPFPITGVHELLDVVDAFHVLRDMGLRPGISTGIPSLDRFYTVALGQWTLVTGVPSHGKSTLVDNIMIRLALRENWRFAVFPPESLPVERYYAGLMEKVLDRALIGRGNMDVSPAEWSRWEGWLNEHFKVILPPEDESWTPDRLFELTRLLVFRYGVKGLVIDPWNEMDAGLREHGLSEASLLNEHLTRLRRFVVANRMHAWVTAHPNRLERRADGRYPVPNAYGISGGAAWFNKPDAILVPYRHVAEEDEDITDVHIQKVRWREIGRPGLISLRANAASGTLHDDIDQDRRRRAVQEGVAVRSDALRVPERRPPPPVNKEP